MLFRSVSYRHDLKKNLRVNLENYFLDLKYLYLALFGQIQKYLMLLFMKIKSFIGAEQECYDIQLNMLGNLRTLGRPSVLNEDSSVSEVIALLINA